MQNSCVRVLSSPMPMLCVQSRCTENKKVQQKGLVNGRKFFLTKAGIEPELAIILDLAGLCANT